MVGIKEIASAASIQILNCFVRHTAKIKNTEATILWMKCHLPVIDNMKCPVVTLDEIINDFPVVFDLSFPAEMLWELRSPIIMSRNLESVCQVTVSRTASIPIFCRSISTISCNQLKTIDQNYSNVTVSFREQVNHFEFDVQNHMIKIVRSHDIATW